MKQNRKVLVHLALMGYPLPRIRRALVELTGVTQVAIAKSAGVSRSNVTLHVAGIRNNPKVQEKIAEAWAIPKEELFADVA